MAGAALAVLLVARWLWPAGPPAAGRCESVARAPRLRPDYAGLVIPPNIAPLNLRVAEPGTRYHVRLSAARGRRLDVTSRSGVISLPQRRWRELLSANRGGDLRLEVFARGARGRWQRFEPVVNHVAEQPVDDYVVYRRFRPFYNSTGALLICQRDLRSFVERAVITRDEVGGGCMNCHTFRDRRPDSFLFHSRPKAGVPAMTLVSGNSARTVQPDGPPAGYASWHPGGRTIAYSRNKIMQYFPQAGPRSKAALDAASSLALYDVYSGRVTVPTALNPPGRLPTFPCWSPDGRWLYFASAPRLWPTTRFMPIEEQARVRYDIQRAAYDPATSAFGQPETVVAARDTGGSALEPRISPDGRWLVFSLTDSGSFPVFAERSDLYLLDLQRPGSRPVPLEAESPTRHDSFHAWSGNSRWLVCASKRDNGLLARLYLRYIDAEGRASKPFVLPQRDPRDDDRNPATYNVPEFVSGPITVSRAELKRALAPTCTAPARPAEPEKRQEAQTPDG
ncbi:MAG: PD40 domain-containing protein [Armatimonadetes bacterium]|nr:PD40 domain-containing protein [Armatimonadota bacterium]